MTIKPDETYPNGKIAETKPNFKGYRKQKKEYNSILTEADKNFENEMYSEGSVGLQNLEQTQ